MSEMTGNKRGDLTQINAKVSLLDTLGTMCSKNLAATTPTVYLL